VNRTQKAAAIEEIAGLIQESEAIFAVDYRGLSVSEAAALRARLREADARFRIVKNTLSERAADQAGAEQLKGVLDGPTAFTFVRGDAAVAAKALADFARQTDTLAPKGGLMGADVLTAEDIRSIARLPAREVLYGQLVGTVAAPLNGLVRGLSGMISGLAIALQQVVDEGKLPAGDGRGGGEAPNEDQKGGPPSREAGEEDAQAAAGTSTPTPEAGADQIAPDTTDPGAGAAAPDTEDAA
jgi:large subunit ribosomal protein L10